MKSKIFTIFLIASAYLFALEQSSEKSNIIEIYEGKTYEFAERNILELFKERIEEVKKDWSQNEQKIQNEIKNKIKQYRPKNLAKLPSAQQDNIFLVDMTYTLDRDIPNAAGGFLYRKGYTFNPLDYISLDSKYIVFNAADDKELGWFRKSKYYNDYSFKVILSDGPYFELTEELGRQVYYLPKEMQERMNIQHTVSIISQKDKKIQVEEICVYCLPQYKN